MAYEFAAALRRRAWAGRSRAFAWTRHAIVQTRNVSWSSGVSSWSNFLVGGNYLFATIASFWETAATLGSFSAFGFSAPPDDRHFARPGTSSYVFASALAFVAGPRLPNSVWFRDCVHGLYLADGALPADVCGYTHVCEPHHRGFSWLVAGGRKSDD